MAWLSCKPVENSQGRVCEAGRECQMSQFWNVWVILLERRAIQELLSDNQISFLVVNVIVEEVQEWKKN